jgi:hypothetical protein
MNEIIARVFEDLEDSDPKVNNEAIVGLRFTLERYFEPNRNEEIWKMVLTDQLLSLELAESDVDEMLCHAFGLVTSSKLPLALRISLAQVVGQYAGTKHLGAMLGFLAQHGGEMSEQEAFSFLATLALMMQRVVESGDVDVLKRAIEQANTIALLQNFAQSERVRESTVRLTSYVSANLRSV